MPRGGKRQGAGRPKGTGKFGEATKAVRLPVSMIDRIMGFIERKGFSYPIYTSKVKGMSPVKKDEVPTEKVDIGAYLIPNPAQTFFMKASDDSMTGAGIFEGDLLIVEKDAEPQNGNIVVVAINGKITVKRYTVKNKKIELKPENSKFASVKIADGAELEVWGIVKNVIHSV